MRTGCIYYPYYNARVETPALIDRLKSTPAALRSFVRRLQPGQIACNAGDDGWAPLDVIRHVVASDAIIAPRVAQILVRDRPPLAAFDERAWARLSASAVSVDAQLAAFAIQRAGMTAILRTLLPDQWERAGVHEERGEQTIFSICGDIVGHEEEHLRQLDEVVRALGR